MTDEAIICDFMEPDVHSMDIDKIAWHASRYRCGHWEHAPMILNLHHIHVSESRLDDTRKQLYVIAIADIMSVAFPSAKHEWEAYFYFLNASAEQKIKALAQVLRPLVEESK